MTEARTNRGILGVVYATALVVICAAGLGFAQEDPNAASPSSVAESRQTLNQYCFGCHNDRVRAAGLVLNGLDLEHAGKDAPEWEKVVRKLRARAMPPVGLPRPEEKSYVGLVSFLETSLDRAAVREPNPGRVDTFRRLTRTEYHNAIRDLLELDVDVSSLLPKDDASHGFDNVTVSQLSPTLLERYLAAARKISRLAVGSASTPVTSINVLVAPDLTQEDHLDGLPLGTRGGAVVRHAFPLDAEYEIQVRLSRDRNEHVEGLTEPHQVEIALDGERVFLSTVAPSANKPAGTGGAANYYDDAEVDSGLKVRIPVKAGPREITVAFLKKSSALIGTERQPYLAHFNMDRHPRTQPAVYRISVNGPLGPGKVGVTPSRSRIFVCQPAVAHDERDCARTILSTILRRAYRRPVTDEDLGSPLAFFEAGRVEGGFDTGIENALRAILVSPQFLFRVEKDPANIAPRTAYRIPDLELASRLSFFLWSSIPDDQLLDLAIRGKLTDPAVLEQQVRRLLKDSRSDSLVTNFAEQWLYLRNLDAVSREPRVFPDFDDNLRQAFRRETNLFFQSIVREDRSVVDLLSADYTFLNERLARHYGIPHVSGSHFRRVSLPKDSVYGGLLTQGSILTVTSQADRTSPVLRGKWVLDNILGLPPSPPPPNVPVLKNNDGVGKPLSMRDRMAEHRNNPVCASCHQVMDPLGLSLENFDAIGRWRTRSESGAPVDALGTFPDGTRFEGAAGLRKAALQRPAEFVTTLTEKLMTYGLGRGVDYYDSPAVRAITRNAGADDYRFSALILEIVKSAPFQMRSSQ